MSSTAAPNQLAGSTLGTRGHVRAFFGSARDEHDTIPRFVRDGLERGERANHVFVPPQELLRQLGHQPTHPGDRA